MDTFTNINKNRITRQTESKGRKTNNSSLEFQELPNYNVNGDKLNKKKKNIISDKSNNNSPQTKEVSKKNIESINLLKEFENDMILTQLQTTTKSNITNIKSRLVAYRTMPSQNNNDNNSVNSNTLSSSSSETAHNSTSKYLSSNSKEIGDYIISSGQNIKGKKDESDGDFDNDTIDSDRVQIKNTTKFNIFVQDEQNNKNSMKDGHFNFLHTYVRDDLFKKIKILADSHLELNGYIMKKCLEKSEYDSSKHGAKFINECRSEIRKTMNSRRGYVKRKITALMIGT